MFMQEVNAAGKSNYLFIYVHLIHINQIYSHFKYLSLTLTHCGRVTQICVFNTVKLGTSASSS